MRPDPSAVVLAFDFPGRRVASGFDLLFKQLPEVTGRLVTVPDAVRPFTAACYVDAAVSAVPDGAAVLAAAFCSAAPLAQDAIAHLAARGVPTLGLLLADPVVPGEFTLRDALVNTLGQIGRDDVEDLIEALIRDDTLDAEPELWRRRVLRTVREALAEALGCATDDETVVGLSSRYTAYLDFVLATRSADFSPYPGRCVALSSTGHTTPPDWPGLPSVGHRQTASARRDLLGSPELRTQLLDLLADPPCV
ncbi:hypothetical protein AB4Z54_40740 [Streptomyces sp. MCAF7]